MINKEICKKCRIKHNWWNGYDEKRWKKGQIYCIVGGKAIHLKITDNVPDECSYNLEHIVSLEKAKK